MNFTLIDDILQRTTDRIVVVKQVSLAEEYLQDHFPTFPILPGVFMLEVIVQAARQMLVDHPDNAHGDRLVLGSVKALKYGAMVRPGQALIAEVTLKASAGEGVFDCRGSAQVVGPSHEMDTDAAAEKLTNTTAPARGGATAVSGRFTMRPIQIRQHAG